MAECNVFISYAREDYQRIAGLLRCLRYYGLELFLDQDAIELGSEWKEILSAGIANSNGAIVFLSENSIDSQWVEWECDVLCQKRKKDIAYKLVPVRLVECSVPEQPSGINHADFFDPTSLGADEFAQEVTKTITGKFPRAYTYSGLHGDDSAKQLGIHLERIIESLNLDAKANLRQRMLIEIAQRLRHDRIQLRELSRCKCGGDILCGYVDAGGPDYYDNFFHICTTCFSCNHRSTYSSDFTDQEPGVCPLCQYKWFG